jgi:hypothetical protein
VGVAAHCRTGCAFMKRGGASAEDFSRARVREGVGRTRDGSSHGLHPLKNAFVHPSPSGERADEIAKHRVRTDGVRSCARPSVADSIPLDGANAARRPNSVAV